MPQAPFATVIIINIGSNSVNAKKPYTILCEYFVLLNKPCKLSHIKCNTETKLALMNFSKFRATFKYLTNGNVEITDK